MFHPSPAVIVLAVAVGLLILSSLFVFLSRRRRMSRPPRVVLCGMPPGRAFDQAEKGREKQAGGGVPCEWPDVPPPEAAEASSEPRALSESEPELEDSAEGAAPPKPVAPETEAEAETRMFQREVFYELDEPALLKRDDVKKAVESRQERADRGQFTVWFGTNRKVINPIDFENCRFTNERADKITYGSVDVFVPKAHRFGETGTSFWKKIKRLDFRDDRLRIQRVACLTPQEMWKQLHLEMTAAQSEGDVPHGLVFIHGYNTSFADAAIRAAQIGFDLKIPGATAFFSWPSRAGAIDYPADESMVEESEAAIVDFLDQFVSNSGAEKVHVIAHSMGNRGLLRALMNISMNPQLTQRVRFGQFILAAPDVSRGFFIQHAHVYPSPRSERTTLYASAGDRAVFLSSKLHKGPRAGYFLPYTVAPNIDTIAVPDFDLDLLGHGYFAQAEALLHDMHDLIQYNTPPQARQRIRSLVYANEKLWQVQR
jgi:esterase/lipase superfamily enzyme